MPSWLRKTTCSEVNNMSTEHASFCCCYCYWFATSLHYPFEFIELDIFLCAEPLITNFYEIQCVSPMMSMKKKTPALRWEMYWNDWLYLSLRIYLWFIGYAVTVYNRKYEEQLQRRNRRNERFVYWLLGNNPIEKRLEIYMWMWPVMMAIEHWECMYVASALSTHDDDSHVGRSTAWYTLSIN